MHEISQHFTGDRRDHLMNIIDVGAFNDEVLHRILHAGHACRRACGVAALGQLFGRGHDALAGRQHTLGRGQLTAGTELQPGTPKHVDDQLLARLRQFAHGLELTHA